VLAIIAAQIGARGDAMARHALGNHARDHESGTRHFRAVFLRATDGKHPPAGALSAEPSRRGIDQGEDLHLRPDPARWTDDLRGPGAQRFFRQWSAIFLLSLALFVIRFLVPTPVGMADNGDGPRLMCAFGVAPVTGTFPRYDYYAYFAFDPSKSCASASIYSSSQHLLLDLARLLTPVLGLSGTLNLVALGLIVCIIQSGGIASLACGLRVGPRGRLAAAAAAWLIMADAAFFGTYASPLSEGATLTGLLLVAAGVLYLGRSRLPFLFGLLLAGAGGYLAIMSKEQYMPVAIPICVVLILASADRHGRPGLARFLTPRTAAAGVVTGALAISVLAYEHDNAASAYVQQGHQQQVVDVIFNGILVVDRHDAAADLRQLGLPASWAKYAGTGYWSSGSVVYNPLYPRYEAKLNDSNLVDFELTHPLITLEIGQQAADQALALRVPYLGSYSPSAGHPPGALESRVSVVSSLVEDIPSGFGLFWLVPLWLVMGVIAWLGIRPGRRSRPWHRDCGFAVLLLVGCAMAAFVPAAFFDAEETTRHMLGTNLATALAFALSAALLVGMVRQGLADSPADDSVDMPVSLPRPRVEMTTLAGQVIPGQH
jgi:hypothetical protein